jgi:hypothetical protein
MTDTDEGIHDKSKSELRRMYEERNENTANGYLNYGDANPELHGGLWVQYDAGYWDVIETMHASVYDERFDDTELGNQFVSIGEVHWTDVVTEDGTWSDTYKDIPESVHGGHEYPLGAIVDNSLDMYVAHECHKDMIPYEQPVQMDSYDDVLDRFNVTPAGADTLSK